MRRHPVLVVATAVLIAACGAGAADPPTTSPPSATTAPDRASTTTTTIAPTTATTVEAGAEREAAALAEVRALVDAIDRGDVDDAMAFVREWMEEPQRQRLGFAIAWHHFTVGECRVSSSTSFLTTVECDTEIVDPVLLRTGPAVGTDEYQLYADGISGFNGGIPVARQYADAATAYSTWLQEHRPEDYSAVCDPAGYDEPIESEYGLALTARCGSLLPSVSEEVAAWLDTGGSTP